MAQAELDQKFKLKSNALYLKGTPELQSKIQAVRRNDKSSQSATSGLLLARLTYRRWAHHRRDLE